MKLKPLHAKFIANKITLDLSRSFLVKLTSPLSTLNKITTQIIEDDIKQEYVIESRAKEMLEKYQDEIDDTEADERKLFAMLKKQIAQEQDFSLNKEERYSRLSHEILDELFEEKCLEFNVAENVVKNHILDSIKAYLKSHEGVQDRVMDKIRNYKRKLVVGSQEYELIFTKLYEEEMAKRG